MDVNKTADPVIDLGPEGPRGLTTQPFEGYQPGYHQETTEANIQDPRGRLRRTVQLGGVSIDVASSTAGSG